MLRVKNLVFSEPLLSYHVMIRTKLNSGKYAHLFQFIAPDRVKLR
jgi:hypothetical protein